jgi:hypothetical protein
MFYREAGNKDASTIVLRNLGQKNRRAGFIYTYRCHD